MYRCEHTHRSQIIIKTKLNTHDSCFFAVNAALFQHASTKSHPFSSRKKNGTMHNNQCARMLMTHYAKKKRVKTNIKQKKHKDLHLPFSIDDEFNFNAFLFQCLLTLYMIIIICYYLLMQLGFYLIFNSTGHTNMVWSVAM